VTIITRTVALVAAALLVLTAGAQAGRERQAGRYTSLSYPVWSPDGKHVAWVAGTPENNVNETYRDTVRVADSSGRKVRPLHSFPGQGYPFVQLAWVTPTSLLVATAGPLYRLDLSGRVRLLPQIQTGFFVSLDPSRRFVVAGSEDCPQPDCAGSIKVLNLRTGKVRRVGSPADLNSDPVLSPGAGRVVYHRTT
jgi:hypothetical protein